MRPENDGDWAARLGIKCEYPDGADRCAGCPHYFNPKRNPDCSYARLQVTEDTRHE